MHVQYPDSPAAMEEAEYSSWQKLLASFLRGSGRVAHPFPWAASLSVRDREVFYRELEEAFGDGSDPDWEEILEIIAAWERDALESGLSPEALTEEDPAIYRVVISGRWQSALEKSPAVVREVAEDLLTGFLARYPTSFTEAVPGKLKKFGERGMLFQYQLPSGYRLQYRVDEPSRTVEIEYLGPHQ